MNFKSSAIIGMFTISEMKLLGAAFFPHFLPEYQLAAVQDVLKAWGYEVEYESFGVLNNKVLSSAGNG